jgi:hypothetical protein
VYIVSKLRRLSAGLAAWPRVGRAMLDRRFVVPAPDRRETAIEAREFMPSLRAFPCVRGLSPTALGGASARATRSPTRRTIWRRHDRATPRGAPARAGDGDHEEIACSMLQRMPSGHRGDVVRTLSCSILAVGLTAPVACKVRSTTASEETGILGSSDNGLAVIFAPGGSAERMCAVICDGERIAADYADKVPLDPVKLCTSEIHCVSAAAVKSATDAVTACYAKAERSTTLLEAVKAERIANPSIGNNVAPCEPEVGRLTATMLEAPGEPLAPSLVQQLTKELTSSTETALSWLAAAGYLAGSAAAPTDPTSTIEIVTMTEKIVLDTTARQTLTDRNADLVRMLAAMRGLSRRLPGEVSAAQERKRKNDAAIAQAAWDAQIAEINRRAKEASDAADRQRQYRAPWEALKNWSSWYSAPRGWMSAGTFLDFNVDMGFVYRNGNIYTRQLEEWKFASHAYSCAYYSCTSRDGGAPITIDTDGHGFVMGSDHFR